VIHSERLFIRDLTPPDYAAALLVYRKATDFMERLSGYAPEALNLALVEQEAAEAREHGARYAGIFRRTDSALLGLAIVQPHGYKGDKASAWIALLLLGEPHQRQGYGRDAYRLLEKEIFADPAVRRIKLGVLIHNEGALHFWHRVGFRRQGGVARSDGHEVYILVKGRPSA
jgi:RimJ/RimL family protein N-acetyltransferase